MARTNQELYFTDFADFPTTWSANILYVAEDTDLMYRWNWSAYAVVWDWWSWADVTWPASSTDNAIARFDSTTWKIIQNSWATIDDSWNLTANNFSWSSSWTSLC